MRDREEEGVGGERHIERNSERWRKGERIIFILRMTVLGRDLIFQPVLLACTYSDTIITS